MTEEEVLAKYNQMEELFGTLPSWKHEPIQFEYLVKLYLRKIEDKNDPRIS
jgi:hypothetical protein